MIVDDGGYGMLRFDQDLAGEARFGVDLQTPDFEAMAASFGLGAETVEGLDDEFGEALARHVADAGAERARGAGGGARPAADDVAELVSQAAIAAELSASTSTAALRREGSVGGDDQNVAFAAIELALCDVFGV